MKKNKLPSIVSIAILTLITCVFWIFFNIYRAFTKVTPLDIPTEIMAEINPNLDTKALDDLENRVYLEENQIPQTQITLPEETPESTEEPEIETPILLFFAITKFVSG